MDPEFSPKLSPYERITAITLALFILSLASLNFYLDEGPSPQASAEAHYISTPLVEVTIKGAVARPGVYQVKKGSDVADAIKMAVPLQTANLQGIKLDSKITRRRTITIKEKRKAA